MKNGIREIIKLELSKREVEARLQNEKKLEGGINIYQWNRLSASRNQPEEILSTQKYRTRKSKNLTIIKPSVLKVLERNRRSLRSVWTD